VQAISDRHRVDLASGVALRITLITSTSQDRRFILAQSHFYQKNVTGRGL